jgi:hypothetical protein
VTAVLVSPSAPCFFLIIIGELGAGTDEPATRKSSSMGSTDMHRGGKNSTSRRLTSRLAVSTSHQGRPLITDDEPREWTNHRKSSFTFFTFCSCS